jgi:hypothetical protein
MRCSEVVAAGPVRSSNFLFRYFGAPSEFYKKSWELVLGF